MKRSETTTNDFCDTKPWAQKQWGNADLGDLRLQERAVEIGAQMAMFPGASLPQQMQDAARLKAAYRLLDNPKVTHESLGRQHWQATREKAATEPIVLMIQDITELDYTHYAATMRGLGPIGRQNGAGWLMHSTLAVVPGSKQIIGLAQQQVFKRKPLPAGATHKQLPKHKRESVVWPKANRDLGLVPTATQWVAVGDRGADSMDYMLGCRASRMDFNIRLAQNRRLVTEDGSTSYLFETVRSWEPVVGKKLEIAASHGHKARTAHILVSFGQLKLRISRKNDCLAVHIVRAWEIDAPEDVTDPIEWVLATSVAIACPEDALCRLDWYTTRWLIEDYHQCLKTGCTAEERDFEHAARIKRLLGFLAIIAMRLLQLRQASRLQPQSPATTVAEPLLIALVAKKADLSPNMTVREFWRGVAKLGGFRGRRSDGQPGWRTLWRGWLYLANLFEGVLLASSLSRS